MSEIPQFDVLQFFDRENLPSFVDAASCNFFNVEPIGHDEIDRSIGEAVANEALAYARRYRSSAVIAFALMSIAERGGSGHLEAGFIVRISSVVMAGSLN
jgi:hypothetical protein